MGPEVKTDRLVPLSGQVLSAAAYVAALIFFLRRRTALDVKDLRVFEAVARHEGMKRAALELNTVQSNVTAHIRALEDELGVLLFERRSSGMVLTPAGIRLLPYAIEVRVEIENAKRAITDGGTPSGPLVIGSRKTTTALHLNKLLCSYLAEFPAVDITVRTETTPLLTDLILERRIEGAFVCDPAKHHDLVTEIILDEELAVFTAPEISSIAAIPSNTRLIVLGQGSYYQRRLRAILARQNIEVARVMELDTLELIVGCVGAGLGVTLLPRAVLNLAPPDAMRAHRVTGEDCQVQTLFARRRDGFVSSALSTFLDSARLYGKAFRAI